MRVLVSHISKDIPTKDTHHMQIIVVSKIPTRSLLY